MKRRKRVLHLVGKLRSGGIQVQLARVLPALADAYEFEIMGLFDGGPMGEVFSTRGIRPRRSPIKRSDPKEAVERLRHKIRMIEPDVVHAHDRQAVIPGLEAAQRAGVAARIAHYHTPHPRYAEAGDAGGREQRAIESATHLLACSEWVRSDLGRRLPGLKDKPWIFAPNAVDLEHFSMPEPPTQEAGGPAKFKGGAPVIGTVSRIDPVKNHPAMIEAARRLKAAGHDFEFWIIGGGWKRYVEELQRQIDAAGVGDCVVLKGHFDDPAPLLRAMDVFVIASRNEGMPLAILEAWASGAPVVAAGGGALSGQIRDGEDGLLVDLERADSLAATLERLLGDASLRDRLARAGRERAGDYSVENAASILRGVYAEALSRRSGWRQRLPFWRSA